VDFAAPAAVETRRALVTVAARSYPWSHPLYTTRELLTKAPTLSRLSASVAKPFAVAYTEQSAERREERGEGRGEGGVRFLRFLAARRRKTTRFFYASSGRTRNMIMSGDGKTGFAASSGRGVEGDARGFERAMGGAGTRTHP
jgi:hypothetical protein